MTSVQSITPRDEVRSFVAKVKNEQGKVLAEVPCEYYPNRITLSGVKFVPSEEDLERYTDDELDNIQAATTICTYLKSWELEGPAEDPVTGEIIEGTASGEHIPLDPRIVRFLPTLLISGVMEALTEQAFPNLRKSRNERRRSR